MSSPKVVPLIPSLIVAAVMIAMINLGFWQLRRYDEKMQLQSEYDARAAQSPKLISELSENEKTLFQRVMLRGHFQATPQWLIANQFQREQLGFYVLSVFVTETGQRVIVNRGFVVGGPNPNSLPDISLAESPVSLTGHLYVPSTPWRSPPLPPQQAGVNLLPVLDWTLLRSSLASEQLFPLMVRLDPDSAFGYRRDWQIIASIPEKHRAYAVQWFAMTIALLALYGLFLNKRFKTFNRQKSSS